MTMRYMISLHVALCASLLPSVAAQTFFDPAGPGFDAPPLQQANLAFYCIFTVATLVPLGVVVAYLFRGHSPHLLPGVGALVALLMQIFSHGMDVAFTVAQYTYVDDGNLALTSESLLKLQIPSRLFNLWVVPLLFLAIVLVLRDRYIAYARHETSTPTEHRATSFLPFTATSCVLTLVMFITSTAITGILAALFTVVYSRGVDDVTFNAKSEMISRFDHAFVGLDTVAAIFLVGLSYVVRRRTKGDKIASMTVFGVVPLYFLNTLSRIVYEVLFYRLPLDTADQQDFSNTVVYRTLFFAIDCIFIHFFVYPKLWIGPGEQKLSPYAGFPPQYHGGVQPPAQFPGQWGFTGQPSRGLPATNGPPQGLDSQATHQPGIVA